MICPKCHGEGIILKLRRKPNNDFGGGTRGHEQKERIKVCRKCNGKGYL